MRHSKRFVYYQPNKKDIKDKYGDCVIRALTKVTDKTWVEVFDELTPIARDLQTIPNSKPCYSKYLDENEFKYKGVSNKKGTKRPTVDIFAKDHKTGTFVVRAAHHLVAIVNGCYYDTWDSGDCCLYGYWEK